MGTYRAPLRIRSSNLELESVVCGDDIQKMTITRDLLEPPGLLEHCRNTSIIVRGLVMVQRETLRARGLADLDTDHVARMSPVRLDGDRIGKRVHGVEDYEVRFSEEISECIQLARFVELML